MDAYNRICSLISEYAKIEKTAAATNAYLEEHYEPLIQDKALEVLASI
jgi:adapter protein MecA 1/2